MDEHARRRWVVPPAAGELDGLDLGLLDPADEDERGLLIEAEHPELSAALRSGRGEVKIAGQKVNPTLHVALHQGVANQIWDDEPPETWLAAQRLTALGYDRHDVLHMLMFVIGEDVRRAVTGEPQRTPPEVAGALEALPAGWVDVAPGVIDREADVASVALRARRSTWSATWAPATARSQAGQSTAMPAR